MNLSLPSRRLSVRRELWLLGRLRWQLARNSLVSHVRQHHWRLLLLTTMAGLFLVGDYAFFFRLLRHMSTMPGELGPLLMGQLLHMIFLTFFSMLIFSNTVTSLSTIYLSSDLLMLMSSPLRLTNVFVAKFVQTLLYSSWMVLLFGCPIFIAFGQVQRIERVDQPVHLRGQLRKRHRADGAVFAFPDASSPSARHMPIETIPGDVQFAA